MIKRVLIGLICLISASAFAQSELFPAEFSLPSVMACPDALPTNDVNFCDSFRTSATCYCVASGVPSMFCKNVNTLYNRMISIFGSIASACAYQKYTPTQNCIDNWNCYMFGGLDSQGRACSSTQNSCQ